MTAPPVPLAPPGSRWTFRALEPDSAAAPSPDVDLVHRWMHAPHVEAWWHEAWPRELWAETVHAFRETHHAMRSVPVFACSDSAPGPGPVAYLQIYRVARDRLASAYGNDEHDLGLHIAIGRDTDIDRRHGRAILRAACEGLLAADPRCRRVVAEPDEANQLSVRAFLASGFEYARRIEPAREDRRAAGVPADGCGRCAARGGGVVTVPAPPVPVLPEPWTVTVVEPGSPEVELVHRWMHEPHVAPSWKQTWTLEQWSEKVRRHLAEDHTMPVLVGYDGEPVAYLQIYRVLRDRIAPYYEYDPYDLGVHIAIGEKSLTGKGIAVKLGAELAPALFAADPLCRRIVGEPDVTNRAAVRVAEGLGFRAVREIELPDKTALLMELVR